MNCTPKVRHKTFGVQYIMYRYLSEHRGNAEQGGYEGVYLFAGVVGGEGGADRAGDAEALHQRLGAVVAGAHGYAEAVE